MERRPRKPGRIHSHEAADAKHAVQPAPASAAAYLPDRRSVASLRRALKSCRGCDLYLRATQPVAGEGPSTARLVLVGEVPGNMEDKTGHPFVGPAGALLDDALKASGIERSKVFLTNAVKHFKWEPRGKRRLHARPSSREIAACRPWLDAELVAARLIAGRD
jgi:uracil-DNA glycosylase family protein